MIYIIIFYNYHQRKDPIFCFILTNQDVIQLELLCLLQHCWVIGLDMNLLLGSMGRKDIDDGLIE